MQEGCHVLPYSGAPLLCSPLQAGGKHYHPTCARCVRCHQMFTEGEEMYLTGRDPAVVRRDSPAPRWGMDPSGADQCGCVEVCWLWGHLGFGSLWRSKP